jgi:lipopolysaccharide/colanic/teichoic acid biosynthesis glycosyltransferase
MINIIFGTLASLIGFLTSPQFDLSSSSSFGWKYVLRCSFLIGIMLGMLSNICGHDLKMWCNSKVDFLVNVLVSASIGILVTIGVFYLAKIDLVGRWVLLITWLSYVNLVVLHKAITAKERDMRISIYGAGTSDLLDLLTLYPIPTRISLKVLDRLELERDLENLSFGVKKDISRIYLIPGSGMDEEINSLIGRYGIFVGYVVASIDLVLQREFKCVNVKTEKAHVWWDLQTPLLDIQLRVVKRCIDLTLAAFLACPAALIILISAFLIKFTDGGPIFYRQTRLGQFRKPFSIIKLRTMVVESEDRGPQWAEIGDKRVTRIGKFMRRTRIDELPQVWNILRGEMSFIGPRPERPEFFRLIEKECPNFGLRLVCKPGLTGWAQINYPYSSSINDAVVKLMFDLYYIKNVSFVMELRIIIRTVLAMVKGAR